LAVSGLDAATQVRAVGSELGAKPLFCDRHHTQLVSAITLSGMKL